MHLTALLTHLIGHLTFKREKAFKSFFPVVKFQARELFCHANLCPVVFCRWVKWRGIILMRPVDGFGDLSDH
jgi:hypothetical protein